jgi:hypothetical protein
LEASSIPECIERFDLLLPLGVEQAIAMGNLAPNQPFESILQWDLHHPYRYGVTLLSSHGRLGDRLQRLTDLAQFFRLDTELDLPFIPPRRFSLPSTFREWLKTGLNFSVNSWIALDRGLPLLPRALCQALIVGIGFRMVLMLVGAIAYVSYKGQLVWLSQDQDGDLIAACYWISFSLILIFQINSYYPEVRPIKHQRIDHADTFAALQTDATLNPQNRQIIRLKGKLWGRRGVHNGLGQVLILETSAGLIRLHHCPRASVFGDWGFNAVCPKDLIGQPVNVGGWLRRGAHLAVDLAYLEGRSQRRANSYYPWLLSILAIASGLWGAYLVWQT